MKKVVLGLSGGVDSAVAASLLLREGYDVRGLYLDVGAAEGESAARQVAEYLNIPLTVRDVRLELEKHVCAPFAACYLRGETPNPCVMCNREVKFRALLEEADAQGAEQIATGHYAAAVGGRIYKGRPRNDQSYMLCRLTAEEAARFVTPLGAFEKDEVRAMARELALPPAEKADSMEICFIPDNDYAAWLERRGQTPPPGDFIFEGRVIGRHRGIHHYTLGQRKHFGVSVGRRAYVSDVRPETNEVVLSDDGDVFRTEIRAGSMSFITPPAGDVFRAGLRVRHTRLGDTPCTVELRGDTAFITADVPVRAPARGQAAALYDGELLLGGGFIE